MTKHTKTNWRTSIAGLIMGVASVAYPYLDGKEITWKNVTAAIVIGTLGVLAKDQWIGYGTNSKKNLQT